MDTILIDTSVWINYFKDVDTNANRFLTNNITNIILATCPTIIQEVLQGIVFDSDKRKVSSQFDILTKLIEDPYEIAIEASELYRLLRKKGITIRKPNDCLIAVYAIRNKISLLHDDRDFHFITQHSSLKVISFNE
jgi:predicted nucleic acid-binding protein